MKTATESCQAFKLTNAHQVRNFLGLLLDQLRYEELPIKTPTIQWEMAKFLLATIKDHRAALEKIEVD